MSLFEFFHCIFHNSLLLSLSRGSNSCKLIKTTKFGSLVTSMPRNFETQFSLMYQDLVLDASSFNVRFRPFLFAFKTLL